MGKAETPLESGYRMDNFSTNNPSLQEALNRAVKTTQSSFEAMAEVAGAVSPVKSLFEISEQTRALHQSLDWNTIGKNMLNWSAYSEPVTSLTEIHQAAFKKLSAEQSHMVNTLASSHKALFNTVNDGANTEEVLANFIDKTLDAYEAFSSEQQEKTQLLSTIQAAYLAWYQQTLTSFNRSDSKTG